TCDACFRVHMAVVVAHEPTRRSTRCAGRAHQTTPARRDGERVTVSRHDRFGAVIAAGQRIMQSRFADEVRAALCDVARTLIGAEHCSVIDLAEGAIDLPPVDHHAGPGSSALVSAALRSGHLVVWPADDGTIPGPVAVRSALCAPIP